MNLRGAATRVVLLAALSLVGCGAMRDQAVRPVVPVGSTQSAAELFADLESRLLDAGSLEFAYEITAEGAFSAALSGSFMAWGERADIAARGTFGGAPVVLQLTADAKQMSGGNAERTFRVPRTQELRPALVIGLTRMGLLHNLARLTAAAPPDRAEGGVREWVEVRDVAKSSEVDDARDIGLTFSIHVSGQRAGRATLVLDRTTGLPHTRRQQVAFPGGTMNVVERYRFTPRGSH